MIRRTASFLFRMCLIGAIGILLLAVIGMALGLGWERSQRAKLDAQIDTLQNYQPPTSVEVYDRKGNRFDSFAVERRIWMPLSQMPPILAQAVMAAEDRRFRSHTGVDWWGVARAMRSNFAAGRIRQGGSTLTQQLVKNLVVGNKRSYARKLEEALLARRLEARLSKDEILELYLNYSYFGSGNYGVEAASRDYFGISVTEINIRQAALLASLIPAPSRYSPRADVQRATTQRRRVLDDLVEVGLLNQASADLLALEPIKPAKRKRNTPIQTGHAYRTEVRRAVRNRFRGGAAYRLGLKIHTPYDPALQASAEQAIREATAAVESRKGRIKVARRLRNRAHWDRFRKQGEDWKVDEEGIALEPQPGDCLLAMFQRPWVELLVGPHKILPARDQWRRKVRSLDPNVWASSFANAGRWGDLFEVCINEEGRAVLQDESWVDGAAVIIENSTGGVVALVGGVDMELEGFSFATQAKRQPGSTFKPYVYGTALAAGADQLSEVYDAPVSVAGWRPTNSGGGYAGRLPMRFALARSLNTVSVRLAHAHGTRTVAAFAKAAGVKTQVRTDLSMSLGSSEVTVLDQATGYATLARGGLHTEPVFLLEVRDLHDQLLAAAGETLEVDDETIRLPGSDGTQAIPAHVSAQLVDMLREVVRSGTGRKAWVAERDRAGKTGTTTDFVDAWFVGMTPTHTVAVWIGSDTPKTLGRGETGARAALPAWKAIVEILEQYPDTEARFAPDPSVRLVPYAGRLVALPRSSREDIGPVSHLPLFPGTEEDE